jgi:hypothetical protein
MYPPGAPPPPGAHPPQPSSSQAVQTPGAQPEQPQTVNPSDTARKDDVAPAVERNGVEAVGASKKRSRATKAGEPRVKKAKMGVNGVDAVAAAPGAKEPEHETTTHAATGDGVEQQVTDDAGGEGGPDKSA